MNKEETSKEVKLMGDWQKEGRDRGNRIWMYKHMTVKSYTASFSWLRRKVCANIVLDKTWIQRS